ncbi:WhiB family transcriptional regulator [Streptomyces sp. NPDC052077]|uniref:WhiB family transcriptional regulator n=1 Tax=Streptomyces sp. NPDC052077 TaxID=3154757 RepID=UPI0034409450
MTGPRADWRTAAACTSTDAPAFFALHPDTAKAVCARCPVRAECLHDALATDAPDGVWGGLTIAERRALPRLPADETAALDLLRTLTSHPSLAERTAPMPQPTEDQPATSALTVDVLLTWGDSHVDPDVQDQAARARAALTGLRARHASDHELTALTGEEESLAARLAEIRARKAELLPKRKPSAKKNVDYPAAEVRAWARAQGRACPATGRVPRDIVTAWRAATGAQQEQGADRG